jgi:formylglycine-generating enzyme required for sulfatase activity
MKPQKSSGVVRDRDDEGEGDTTNQLEREFEFEVLTVDRQGEVIARRTCRAQSYGEDLGNGVVLEMVAVPGGMFMMGSSERQGYEDEHPLHRVMVAPFFLGKYPVTQAQWQAVMGRLPPCRCKGAELPVDRVAWHDARRFCERLSERTGRVYRLPGEAEWEYACRAGTRTPFYFGETLTTDLANYVGEHTYRAEPKGVYRHKSTEPGSFPPNAFGLYDMHGNLWEWCADAWHDTYAGAPLDGKAWESKDAAQRVLRGGSWHEPPDNCRSAVRLKSDPAYNEDLFGFRVAATSVDGAPIQGARGGRVDAAGSFARRIRRWFGG